RNDRHQASSDDFLTSRCHFDMSSQGFGSCAMALKPHSLSARGFPIRDRSRKPTYLIISVSLNGVIVPNYERRRVVLLDLSDQPRRPIGAEFACQIAVPQPLPPHACT